MADAIRVSVSGAAGRMGQQVVHTVMAQGDMKLVGALDVHEAGRDAGGLAGGPECRVLITPDVSVALSNADVLVDFTRGDVSPAIVKAAVERGVACVVGTTGIRAQDVAELTELSALRGVPVLIAPNFALGAVLMMRFAQEAARYYEWAEITELHHEKKVDAPSGTALRTAELMSAQKAFRQVANESQKLPGARGAVHGGVHIHSVRLPGLVAHQEVLLGGEGETLTLRHDSLSRTSFMPGVLLAIRKIRAHKGLLVGLEHLM